jgi:hypothetical protein
MDVEILEWDRAQVAFVEKGERVGVESRWSIDIEPGQVRVSGGGIHEKTLRS